VASPPGTNADTNIYARNTDWHQLMLVCATQFMAWAGFGAILPYLPVFLKEQGHAKIWMIGVVASAYYVATFLFSSPLGRLSDLIGRKPVILTGSVFYAIATLLFVTTRDPWWFLLFRFVEGLGAAATGPAGNAFVADITTDDKRSQAFGWLTTAQFGGLIAGPLAGSLIMGLGGGGMRGFHAIFLVGSATMATISIALAVFLHEPAHAVRRRREKVARPSYRSLASPPVIAFLVIAATGHFAMGAWEVLWSLWLRRLHASMTFIGWTWAAFSLPMLLSFLGGYIADRGNRFWLMFSGYAVSGFAWIMYGATRNLTAFLLFNILEGFAIAWAWPAKAAFLVQVSPRRWLGTVQGMEQTSMQLAALIGTLLAPILYERIGGYAIGIGGVLLYCGMLYAGPILYREWNRISASGEVLPAAEAERLITAEPRAIPDDDLFINR
jgi:DHA1 family multidrug resistance protein-like MFS transporter